MSDIVALDPTRLVVAALTGLVILLALIIRFKVPAMIAILVGAVLIGLGAGMPLEQIVKAVDDGVGNTLKGIALLVGLGSMFGAILEISGGAQVLANAAEVKRLIVVPNAEHIYNKVREGLRHADDEKRITVLAMQPMEGGNFRQEILGYSLMAALGIRSEELNKMA